MTSGPTSIRSAAAVLVALALAGGGLAACSSSGGGAKPTASGGRVATVVITSAKGCSSDHSTFGAGGITFKVTNKDATAVSEVELLQGERIVGEKENIPPGLGGEFAVTVGAGTYTLYCPGAKTEKTTLTVTGTAAATDSDTAALLTAATTNYRTYVNTQVGYLLSGVEDLDTALHGTDVTAAQNAYMKARPFYEKIEPVAESFTTGSTNLDAEIDARISDVPANQFEGFHRIEQGLFVTKSLTGLATYGDGLVEHVKQLQGLTKNLTYKATELANGAQELLDEVASSKITGEEERYSHIDLLDFANNDEGAEQAFAQLQPVLQKIDPTLSSTIANEFTALDNLVSTYRTTSNASGYVLYTALNASDKQALAAAVKAVQEPLSQVASKVANV